MTILALDHVNIRTEKLSDTIGFFRDVLQMDVVPTPGRDDMEESAWVMDDNGNAVVHIASLASTFPTDGGTAPSPSRGSGAIHHVALNCSDYDGLKDRLASFDLPIVENHFAQIDLRQIFVAESNGILFELNFRSNA